MEEVLINICWDDVTCPICLDFPHNCVLLQCSSFDDGCRPFVCGTDHRHSNCLERFRNAHGMPLEIKSLGTSSTDGTQPTMTESTDKPSCPLCRGAVAGWVVVDGARTHLDSKKRSCEDIKCLFSGTYMELREHAKREHPHSCPSKIDPARQLDWENFQQSSEIVDVLSTIHSETPRGVVLGDYVIEYDDDNDTGDEYEDFPGDDGNWWTSCLLYQAFDNMRSSRHRRSAARASRRGSQHSGTSNSDDGSVISVEFEADDTDVEPAPSSSNSGTLNGSQEKKEGSITCSMDTKFRKQASISSWARTLKFLRSTADVWSLSCKYPCWISSQPNLVILLIFNLRSVN